ncbi:MAG: NAD(P)H-hydrate dehydratase [Opitutaceae bacterium]
MNWPLSHPIVSPAAARDLEAGLFAGDEAAEWNAMRRAGLAVGEAVLRDSLECGGIPDDGRLLVLAGKGHNGGDALLAALSILAARPAATVEVLFVFGSRSLRPLAARAWRELVHGARGRVREVRGIAGAYDAMLDGVFGFQFRPPVEPRVMALLEAVNAAAVRVRAAVDLPSAGVLRADFTYATGSVKTPVLEGDAAGRVRYLDLGFFRGDEAGNHRVLLPGNLEPLARLRPPVSDKRTFGHVFIIGGSAAFPGSVLLATLAALKSGAGLVTAFVPEPLVPAFAAQAPEAMWVGWPLTPGGGLALEGEHLLREKLPRATALVMGPGLGREAETTTLARSIAVSSPVPLVLDADALTPEVVKAVRQPCVLTPHAGELARIGGSDAVPAQAVLVAKGPATRIVHGGIAYESFSGGPVLARGGSGDLLAGLIGGLLAQTPSDPLSAACRGVLWQGLAADRLARARGQTAVRISELLDHLSASVAALGETTVGPSASS